jgi:hypothetical protein
VNKFAGNSLSTKSNTNPAGHLYDSQNENSDRPVDNNDVDCLAEVLGSADGSGNATMFLNIKDEAWSKIAVLDLILQRGPKDPTGRLVSRQQRPPNLKEIDRTNA